MRKIQIHEFNGHSIFDVFAYDEHGKLLNKKHNLTQDLAEMHVYNFVESYQFQDHNIITAIWFDDELFERGSTERTVQQWKEDF